MKNRENHMQDLSASIVELIRMAATDLPADIEASLERAHKNERPGTAAEGAIRTILENIKIARKNSTPICQDTGTPLFYVHYPLGWSTRQLRNQIEAALELATEKSYLRPNAVDSISGKNSGNNLGGDYFPNIHFEESNEDELIIDLMLKGGGCENVGAQYALPDRDLDAGRDLEGVRRVALDAVNKAQGKGCAPGILGIAIGGDRGSSYSGSKEILLRKIGDKNPQPILAELEEQLLEEGNLLGIGPMGFGGETTLLDVNLQALHRLPASYFVSVSYMCWAHRRRRMMVSGDQVRFE
jgi:fumarate hydratase, class I